MPNPEPGAGLRRKTADCSDDRGFFRNDPRQSAKSAVKLINASLGNSPGMAILPIRVHSGTFALIRVETFRHLRGELAFIEGEARLSETLSAPDFPQRRLD
ncbi:MAG: hypothetical protein ACI8UO_003146 [Verrucomicrobiales bacterium]